LPFRSSWLHGELFEKLRVAGNPNTHIRRLTASRAKLLIIDEVGYEPLDRVAAARFSAHLRPNERGSIVITAE
jgi:DNA replication protein DnaC